MHTKIRKKADFCRRTQKQSSVLCCPVNISTIQIHTKVKKSTDCLLDNTKASKQGSNLAFYAHSTSTDISGQHEDKVQLFCVVPLKSAPFKKQNKKTKTKRGKKKTDFNRYNMNKASVVFCCPIVIGILFLCLDLVSKTRALVAVRFVSDFEREKIL